jgi:hypothetical protein
MNKEDHTTISKSENNKPDENQKLMISSHIVIKDKETNEIILNKRLS